tara:strand:+ start:564 stop:758 length:195 start_codon:yes stop_codon:yes gene_type:complete
MRKLIPFIAFACLTGLTATSGLPVMAGGCSGNYNKSVMIECAEDDTECQREKADKLNYKETVRS